MSKSRRRRNGSKRAVLLAGDLRESGTGRASNQGGSPAAPKGAGNDGRAPGTTALVPFDKNLPTTLSSETLVALTNEIARFNTRLEDFLSRESQSTRSGEDRKEMWVLLSALTVVVVFCFVAFYLNQTEVREMHSGLRAEIEQAGQSAATSMERSLAALRLERIPEAQAALDRFIKDKDSRDTRRFEEVLAELQRQSEASRKRLRDDIQSIEENLASLRQISEDIRRSQAESRAGGAKESTELALKDPLNSAGRAAQAPDGAPVNHPPDSAARPLGHEFSSPDANRSPPETGEPIPK